MSSILFLGAKAPINGLARAAVGLTFYIISASQYILDLPIWSCRHFHRLPSRAERKSLAGFRVRPPRLPGHGHI